MKKLLAILGTIGIAGSGVSTVVSCDSSTNDSYKNYDNISPLVLASGFALNNSFTATLDAAKDRLVSQFVKDNSLDSNIKTSDFASVVIKDTSGKIVGTDALWAGLADGTQLSVKFVAKTDDQYIKGATTTPSTFSISQAQDISKTLTWSGFDVNNESTSTAPTLNDAKTLMINQLIKINWPAPTNKINSQMSRPVTVNDFDLTKTIIYNGTKEIQNDNEWKDFNEGQTLSIVFAAKDNDEWIKGVSTPQDFTVVKAFDLINSALDATTTIDWISTDYNSLIDNLITDLIHNNVLSNSVSAADFSSIKITVSNTGYEVNNQATWEKVNLSGKKTQFSVVFTAVAKDKYIKNASGPLTFYVTRQQSITDATLDPALTAFNNTKTTYDDAVNVLINSLMLSDKALSGKGLITVKDFTSIVIKDDKGILVDKDTWVDYTTTTKMNVTFTAKANNTYITGTTKALDFIVTQKQDISAWGWSAGPQDVVLKDNTTIAAAKSFLMKTLVKDNDLLLTNSIAVADFSAITITDSNSKEIKTDTDWAGVKVGDSLNVMFRAASSSIYVDKSTADLPIKIA